VHVHFVSENIGGHATMHLHLRRALAESGAIRATFFDLPRAPFGRRLVGAPVPGLGRLDLDLQVLRAQLAQSVVVRRHLSGLAETPDALHAYTQNAALLSIGYMRKVPTVVSTDVTNRDNAYRIPYRRPTRFTPVLVPVSVACERRVYAHAHCVVAHSTWTADAILAYGIPDVRVEVIPFGISVPPVAPPDRDGGLPRIVFVGTSMERKGGWRLLRIWQRYLQAQTRLTLVTLEPVPPTPGVEVRNDVRPGDGKLEQILAGADIFALPGEIDAFGYALLEAMAASLPVVAPCVAAVPEIVLDGLTGLLVPPGDDEAFAAALARLAADPIGRQGMGLAGRARLVERFDAAVTTRQLIDLVSEVTAS
jgi:glycosyltransferase involved in cell wall biosynthesis